jgi:hypothetical protein
MYVRERRFKGAKGPLPISSYVRNHIVIIRKESQPVLIPHHGHPGAQEAVEQLQRLTTAKPSDPDVWRVLGESQSALGDSKAAIASYRRAWQEVQAAGGTPGALEVLQGLAGQLIAAGQEQQVGPRQAVHWARHQAQQPLAGSAAFGSLCQCVYNRLLVGVVQHPDNAVLDGWAEYGEGKRWNVSLPNFAAVPLPDEQLTWKAGPYPQVPYQASQCQLIPSSNQAAPCRRRWKW